MQREFAYGPLGPSKAHYFVVALVKGDGGSFGSSIYCYCFILTRDQKRGCWKSFASFRYFEITPFVDSVDLLHSCLCLRRATDGKIHHCSSKIVLAVDFIDVREWYAIVSISSIRTVHRVLRSKYCVASYKPPLLWLLRGFHVHRFHQSRILCFLQ